MFVTIALAFLLFCAGTYCIHHQNNVLADYKEELKASRRETADTKKELEKYKAEIETYKGKLEICAKELEDCRAELATCGKDLTACRKQNTKLQHEYNELKKLNAIQQLNFDREIVAMNKATNNKQNEKVDPQPQMHVVPVSTIHDDFHYESQF